jgi:uncharacterized protein
MMGPALVPLSKAGIVHGHCERIQRRDAMTDTSAIREDTAHRPWPLPSLPWIIGQSWQQQLFAHWPVPATTLHSLVPAPLVLDEFEGTTYVGITPFVIRDHRFRGVPLPLMSTFPEMNLRTYVRYGGKSGVFFFSLDAASRLAVHGARASFRLPYYHAAMSIETHGEWITYRSTRLEKPLAQFSARYRPVSESREAVPGTLEYFLTERYALFVVLRNGSVMRGDIHHSPWQLHDAEAEISMNTLGSAHGISLPAIDPILHYSARQDALIWPPVHAS